MSTAPTFFFTADEHYGHTNIIKYCERLFASVEDMDAEIIKRHNELVVVWLFLLTFDMFTVNKLPIGCTSEITLHT